MRLSILSTFFFLRRKNETYYAYYRSLDRHGIVTVVLLHFMLVVPFVGINYALGLTRIRYRDFIIGTVVGLFPARSSTPISVWPSLSSTFSV